jgi:hypothetical protein
VDIMNSITESTFVGLADPEARQTRQAIRLLAAADKKSYDPRVDIEWDAPLAEDKLFLPEKRCTLYGTELWDSLTFEQKQALSREELASSIALGVWTEQMLMQMVARYIYDRDVASPSVQFAMTEVADEVRHMIMFSNLVKKIGARTYPTPWSVRESGRFLKTFAPVSTLWALLLLTERIFDRTQREMASDESVQPVVRQMCKIHTFEESRHISFARAEIETFLPKISWFKLFFIKMVLALTVRTLGSVLFNPLMYARAGIDPKKARKAALANLHNKATFKFAAAEVAEFFISVGLIRGISRWIWKREGFI